MAKQKLEMEFVVPGDIVSVTTTRRLKRNLLLVTKIKRNMRLTTRIYKNLQLTSNLRRGF